MMTTALTEDVDEKLLTDAKAIAEQLRQLYEQAYREYAPAVEDICSRNASEHEVDLFLDYLLDFAGEDRMLGLYKRVCRRYFHRYPEVVADHVYAWRDLYDDEWLNEHEKVEEQS